MACLLHACCAATWPYPCARTLAAADSAAATAVAGWAGEAVAATAGLVAAVTAAVAEAMAGEGCVQACG